MHQLCVPLQSFWITISHTPFLRMLFHQMLQQVHSKETGQEFLSRLNDILHEPPAFNKSVLVGFPINELLVNVMATPSGYHFFRNEQVNSHLKSILDYYRDFLDSAASVKYLDTSQPHGWFQKQALQSLNMQQYQCDCSLQNYGFKSWNSFFIRKFRTGQRVVEQPDNEYNINSACECTSYHISYGVLNYDKFWLKQQKYSLHDILDVKDSHNRYQIANKLQLGTIYQAFLNTFNYHRWHSPVNGKIVDVYKVNGTYYSQAETAGFDIEGPYLSQKYLSAVSTRLIIIIQTKCVGIVACVFIGMAEVSSCVTNIQPGDQVKKGDEIGYFQYGGSSYCLIIESGKNAKFKEGLIKLNSVLCEIAN